MDNQKYMAVINLHEVDMLEEVLHVLSELYVKDCVVYSAEGIVSKHKGQEDSFSLGLMNFSLSTFLNEPRNKNFLIISVTDKKHKSQLAEELSAVQKENRLASSFWFLPIEEYHYHKGNAELEG